MINRILIRIKVIQLLYSYLLIEQRFSLESQPVSPTKEKRFAYALYLDMLYLMLNISENLNVRTSFPLLSNRFVKSLSNDELLRPLALRYNRDMSFPYLQNIKDLTEVVKESGAFKKWMKAAEHNNNTDATFWKDVFDLIFMQDETLLQCIEGMENYSPGGLEKMKEMMQTTLRNFMMSQMQMSDVLKTLKQSLEKGYELYMRLLLLPVELTRLREMEIDEAMHKYILTEEDRNPNMRFVENALARTLASNEELQKYAADKKISWMVEDRPLLETLLRMVKESEVYYRYMVSRYTDDRYDTEFWREVMRQVIFPSDVFQEYLEDKSIFWNDDLETVGGFALKTYRNVMRGPGEEPDTVSDSGIYPMFKDEEDAKFGAELFKDAVKNRQVYQVWIEEAIRRTSTWDPDRVAFMDMVIMIAVLAEIMNFPKIPLTVSVNEYIEMAKFYSTPKSGGYVHGVLGAIIDKLQAEGTLLKVE